MQRGDKVIEHQSEARGVEQRRAFAHDAPDRQDAAGHDAVHGVGQHNGAHHAPLACAERQRTLAVGRRHGLQALLRRAHDGGQDHHDERQAACEHTRLQIHLLHKKEHTDEAEDDGRDAREGFGRKFDELDDPAVRGVLREIDGGAHAERQDDGHGKENDVERIEDVRQDADGVLDVAACAGEEIPRYAGEAAIEDEADEEKEQRAGQAGTQPDKRAHRQVIRAAARRKVPFHVSPPSAF